ncbi:alpha/beta family hydrolase [Dokdonella sp.]|uniref:alpha/beta family hydrolase n=1 Tax=Dokdonella sp. TaxID=2291710 RepID=UPI0031C95BEF|nr:alpha/beta hydrolase [Dokdonella sp.]
MNTVILSHGLESGPRATKVSAMAEVADSLGWASVRPDYRQIDGGRDLAAIQARIAMALAHAPARGRVVFAGSSMGAYVSGLASLERTCAGLFLLALPVAIPGYARPFQAAPVPTVLVHGWRDEICPVEATIDFARERRATLHVVDDDHRLGAHVAYCATEFGRFLQALG